MSEHLTTTGSSGNTVHVDIVGWHKPIGRGRRFDRMARGLARRLRIPFVRDTIRNRDNPASRWHAQSYGLPWTSNNALADFSFACTCHPRPRFSRKGRKP